MPMPLALIFEVIILGFLVVMFWSGMTSNANGAPFVPLGKGLVKKVLDFGQVSEKDIFYDLGSGDGRVLLYAIKEFKTKKATGYEVAPWPYLESKFFLWQAGLYKKVVIHRQNFFETDLSDATFIYMYLFPGLVDGLAVKIVQECKSGTKVLCPSFPIKLEHHPEFKLLKSEKIGKITAYLYEKI